MHHASANAEQRFPNPSKIKQVTSAVVRHGWMTGRYVEARIAPKRWDAAFIFFFFSQLFTAHHNGRGARVVSLLSTNVAYRD
jgi:hypothetical protein